MSSIVMLPHLAHALRERRPSGTALAWLTGATSSGIWATYGALSGDLAITAPGLVTVPVGVSLAAWCHRVARTEQRAAAEIARLDALYAAKTAHPAGRGRLTSITTGSTGAAGPVTVPEQNHEPLDATLELPRVAA